MATKILHIKGIKVIDVTTELQAFCSTERLVIGSSVKIGESTYIVKTCRYIEMKLFVKSNKLTVLHSDTIFREDNKIKQFIHTLGISNKKEFISAFWKSAKVEGLIASIPAFYCDFTEFSIFDMK